LIVEDNPDCMVLARGRAIVVGRGFSGFCSGRVVRLSPKTHVISQLPQDARRTVAALHTEKPRRGPRWVYLVEVWKAAVIAVALQVR
jgi:uncharacterized protein (DUF3084 family)